MSCTPLAPLPRASERRDLYCDISDADCSLRRSRQVTGQAAVADTRGSVVLNASSLAMGWLTCQGPRPWFPGQPEIVEACRKAAELCRSCGAYISFLGMQFCYAQKRVPCTLTGAARKSELDVNLRAMREPIDESLLADVMKVLDPVRDATWASGNWKA